MKWSIRHPSLRKRVILIFLIMVLLPSAFLSYVGLKGFEKERQWQQQIVEKNLENSLVLAVKQIETVVNDRIRSIFNSLPANSSTHHPDRVQHLESISAQHDIVEHLFILDERNQVVYPPPFREKFWEKGAQDRFFINQNEYLQQGEQFELQEMYEEAVKIYMQGLDNAKTEELELPFLLRMARVEMKLSRNREALRLYSKILTSSNKNWGKIPTRYPLIAYLQIVRLQKKLNPDLLAGTALDFYEFLITRFYSFERPQYDFYLEQLLPYIDSIEKHLSEKNLQRLNLLKQREKTIENNSEFRSTIRSDIIPQLERVPQKTSDRMDLRFDTIRLKGSNWLLAIHYAESETGRTLRSVLMLNPLLFRDFVSDILKEYNQNQELKIVLVDSPDSKIFPADMAPDHIVTSKELSLISSIQSGYVLGLAQSEDSDIEVLYGQNVLLYYFLIITIIVIIVLGLIFLFRDIYREEELARMKSDFISNVSHEIRTPIATIRTLVENLSEGWINGKNQQNEYYSLISRESERLSHIVDNILEFSRSEAKSINLRMRDVPIRDTILRTLQRFKTMIGERPVKFTASVPENLPDVHCDPDAIEQAILNLLDNALKYSGKDKQIIFTVSEENGNIKISVQDNGRGIKKKDLDKIFQKFYRTQPGNGQNVPGSGIGLSLVKDIVDQHSGRIEVQSNAVKGSTFTIYLPSTMNSAYESDTNHRR